MKILFLDMDGVMNDFEWAKVRGFGCIAMPPKLPTVERLRWNPEAVHRLRGIIEITGAQIVISSSWRGCGVEQWKKAFALYGWPDAPVIGETPRLECFVGDVYVAKTRGDEVAEYIGTGKYVEKYVCLDDENGFLPGQPLVQTSMEHGLTQADADKCIDILGAV